MATKIEKEQTTPKPVTGTGKKRVRRSAEEVCDAEMLRLKDTLHKLGVKFPGRYGLWNVQHGVASNAEDCVPFIMKRHDL